MQLNAMPRQIVFNNRVLADLNPEATVDAVVRMHAMTTPKLATAFVEGPELKGGVRVYTVKERLGTKG